MADSLGALAGGAHRQAPAPGSLCPNCDTPLQGPYCHVCGQNSDIHKRSILHLIFESVEGVFHFDGRLRRTLPDLFFRPGRLARDYMEGRIARHVPPFRTFLVALLLFVVGAEYASHRATLASEAASRAHAEALKTPQGRLRALNQARIAAANELVGDLKEAASDRADELKDPDDNHARTQGRYVKEVTRAQARYAVEIDKAVREVKGLTPPPKMVINGTSKSRWLTGALRKAADNPAYYLTVAFAWGHRAAFLMLPIVGLTLAVVYRNKRQYFIYDHLLVAMNFLSFVFLANAPGFFLPGTAAAVWFGVVALWTPINLYQTLRGPTARAGSARASRRWSCGAPACSPSCCC